MESEVIFISSSSYSTFFKKFHYKLVRKNVKYHINHLEEWPTALATGLHTSQGHHRLRIVAANLHFKVRTHKNRLPARLGSYTSACSIHVALSSPPNLFSSRISFCGDRYQLIT